MPSEEIGFEYDPLCNYPFTFEAVLIMTCQYCQRTHEEKHRIAPLCQVPNPVLPQGWIVLDAKPVCDRHVINILVQERSEVVCEPVPAMLAGPGQS